MSQQVSHSWKAQNGTKYRPMPLVSLCIPTFNSEKWISECLNSALAQTYEPLEILIVDDASSDGTLELARSLKDERIRVISNEQNLGLVRNWNRCVQLARGMFIKFLLHDDILYTDCVKRMMELFLSYDNLGLVFSERDIILESDADDKSASEWLKRNATLGPRFDSIRRVNSGRTLFAQQLRAGFRNNLVGEPSSVLVKKQCFKHLGPFNVKLWQICDMEMWLRVMFFYDVGFLPERLSAFRIHARSASFSNVKSRRNWLDALWLLESLSSYEEVNSAHPEIEKQRGLELLRAFKALLANPIKIMNHLRKDSEVFKYFPKWIRSSITYFLAGINFPASFKIQ